LLFLILGTSCLMVDREEQVKYNEQLLYKEGIERLDVGDTAPAFSRTAHDGTTVSLDGGRLEMNYLLYFYPVNFAPNAARELQTLTSELEAFRAEDIQPVGITSGSASDKGDFSEFAEQYGIGIPLIADTGQELAAKYGCGLVGGDFPQRTMVGIGKTGEVLVYKRGWPPGTTADQIIKWFEEGRLELLTLADGDDDEAEPEDDAPDTAPGDDAPAPDTTDETADGNDAATDE
jgi:peroxiredoxin